LALAGDSTMTRDLAMGAQGMGGRDAVSYLRLEILVPQGFAGAPAERAAAVS